MMEIIQDLPNGVVGIASRGKVTKQDYTHIIIPAIEDALRTHDKVSILFIMEDFEGMEISALWEDFSFGVKHWWDFDRAALVSDVQWIRNMTSAFGWMVPAEIEMFHLNEEEKARSWVCGLKPKKKAA